MSELRPFVWVWAGAFWLVSMSGCLGSPGRLAACDSWDTESAICGLMNPEDLALLPGDEWVVVSEMTHQDPTSEGDSADGSMEEASRPFVSGRLTAVRNAGQGGLPIREKLYPREWGEVSIEWKNWGEPECEGPPTADDFQPHGLDVGRRADGRSVLAVVTHGAREVVDLFEILSGDRPGLEWRGCVTVPENVMANDVAWAEDGGFFVTNFMPRLEGVGFSALWTVTKISFGGRTGSVLQWTPGQGFAPVPGSEGSAPNGIAVMPGGQTIFVAEWGKGQIYRLHLSDSASPARESVDVDGSPDNLSFTTDGKLLVASQQANAIKALGCSGHRRGGCDIGFDITLVDPETLQTENVLTGRGAASIALDVGGETWVGFFDGDSILRFPASD